MSNGSSSPLVRDLPASGAWELDDFVPEGMFATDADLVVRYWNAWMERHSGRKSAEVIGRRLLELFPSLIERRLEALYRRALAGEPVVLATRLHRYLLPLPIAHRPASAGEQTGLMQQRAWITPLRRDGLVMGTVTVLEDVTERVEREQALLHQLTVQEALLETSRAVLSLDLNECLKRIVSETAALVGADRAAVVLRDEHGLRIAARVPGDGDRPDGRRENPEAATAGPDSGTDVAEADQMAAWVLQTSQTVRVDDLRAVPPGQRLAALHPHSRSLLGAPLRVGEQVFGALLTEAERPHAFTEAEERVLLAFALHAAVAIQNAQLYRAAQDSELRFRTLIETVGSVLVVLDPQQRIIEFNREAERLLGYRRDEVLGRNALELFIAPERRESAMQLIRQALEEQWVSGFELSVVPRSGQRRTVLWQAKRCTDPTSRRPCIVVSGQDITERLQAEARLRELSQAIEQSPVAVVITDLAAQIRYVNPAFCRITGYSAEEVMGQNPRILKSGHTPPEEYERLWGNLTRGKEWRGLFRNKRKDGSLYWESAVISPVKDAAGVSRAYLAVKEDITERKLAEEERERLITELRQALAEIKTLKGFIPICAGCKKIRDDKGFWQQVEVYIQKHADVTFSHGLCPDCVRKLYPDLADEPPGG